jgi:hypothetical protein
MAVTTEWQISTTEYDLQPEEMDGAIIVAHWRCNGTETVGTGDDAVTYSASNYGTCGFSPDPADPSYTPYADVTESQVLDWCWAGGVDKDATEEGVANAIALQIDPVTASGTPW